MNGFKEAVGFACACMLANVATGQFYPKDLNCTVSRTTATTSAFYRSLCCNLLESTAAFIYIPQQDTLYSIFTTVATGQFYPKDLNCTVSQSTAVQRFTLREAVMCNEVMQ